MPKKSRRLAALLLLLGCLTLLTGVVAAQHDGPTFVPKRYQPDPGSRTNRNGPNDGTTSYMPSYAPHDGNRSDAATGCPGPHDAVSTLLQTGDPITLIPHAVHLANRYGILQCLVVLTVVFVFQYVRNAQKSALQREEFFRQQLEYSDRRTTEELTRLSMKLGELDQDVRSVQDKFDRHGELIRANGELSREIVATMSAHNLAVEKGIGELSMKFDSLAAQRPFRTNRHD